MGYLILSIIDAEKKKKKKKNDTELKIRSQQYYWAHENKINLRTHGAQEVLKFDSQADKLQHIYNLWQVEGNLHVGNKKKYCLTEKDTTMWTKTKTWACEGNYRSTDMNKNISFLTATLLTSERLVNILALLKKLLVGPKLCFNTIMIYWLHLHGWLFHELQTSRIKLKKFQPKRRLVHFFSHKK